MKYATPPTVPTRNVLLYGPPKTRKTTGACTAPGPVGLLNLDLPNATWYAHRTMGENVREIEYEGYKTVQEIQADVLAGKFPHPTIVVDPIGELYARLVHELSRGAVSPALQAYQAAGVHVERFCRALCRSQDVNVVLVCHEFPVKDESTGTVERLAFTGSSSNPSLGNKLMAMVDIIGYTGILQQEGQEPQYVSQLLSGGGRRGGDRFDTLGVMQPTDVGLWFRLIDEAIETRYAGGMTNTDSADQAQEAKT